MNCDPRVIKMEGVQLSSTDVEDGNHLRAFIGVEHGFFSDTLAVHRRPAHLKRPRLRWLKWPARLDDGILSGVLASGGSASISLETNDRAYVLAGSVKLDPSRRVVTLDILFPELVGFLELRLFPHAAPALSSSDILEGSGIVTRTGWRSDRFVVSKPATDLTLRHRASTGMRTDTFRNVIARVVANTIGRLDLRGLRGRLTAIAIYDGEFVRRATIDTSGVLSLVNVPLDQVRISFPLALGFRVSFLPMEADAAADGWEKVEDLPGPSRLRADAANVGAAALFENLLHRRFWPDVRNRFTRNARGWEAIAANYGGPQFKELVSIVEDVFARSGWIHQLVRGSRAAGGYRARESLYVTRPYDPERLGFLNLMTQDVNIATLLGLHTVDRGQNPALAERTDDPAKLKKAGVGKWALPYDYKVQGSWPHLAGDYAYVFYDVGVERTQKLPGVAITDSATLDAMRIAEGNQPTRQFDVGLAWNITQDVRGPTVIAYDIYRGNRHVTAAGPVTPARREETPATMELDGQTVRFHPSLPRIPPFTKPTEILAARFQHIDTASYGATTYSVEAVDVHGRSSSSNLRRGHDVAPEVPLPVPMNLRAEVRAAASGGFEISTRWDWLSEQRSQAPGLERFDVFFQAGPLRPNLKGAVLWIEKEPGSASAAQFRVEGYADVALDSAEAAGLAEGDAALILTSAGRAYPLSDVEIAAGSSARVSIFRGKLKAKSRSGQTSLPKADVSTRGMLFKRVSNGVMKVPFLFEREPSSEALTGDGATVSLFVNARHSARFEAHDVVRVLLDKRLLAATVETVSGEPRALDGSTVATIGVRFEAGWAQYHVPFPSDSCSWTREGGGQWIEWSDGGEIAVQRPSEYPLVGAGSSTPSFPVRIATAPAPRFISVTDDTGAPVPALNSAVLAADGFAAPADGLLAGCKLTSANFNVSIRTSLKGERAQLVTTVPGDVADEATLVDQVSGVAVNIARASVDYTGAITTRSVEAGQTVLTVRLDNDDATGGPPAQEWTQCALGARAAAIESEDLTSPPIIGSWFYFRILRAAQLPDPNDADPRGAYEFVVANLILCGSTQVNGVEQRVDFEAAPAEGAALALVPHLQSAAFTIGGIADETFYRNIDGGEISYRAIRQIKPNDPVRDPDNPVASQTIEVAAQSLAVSILPSAPETLNVAFFPVLDPFIGFLAPLPEAPRLFPSFRATHAPAFLSEALVRGNTPIHASARAIAREGTHEFLGSLAPVVQANPEKAFRQLAPPAGPGAGEIPHGPAYAEPNGSGATYSLSWQASTVAGLEYRVYRVSADAVDEARGDGGRPAIHSIVGLYRLEGFDPADRQRALTWTFDGATAAYPVIRDIREGNDPVADGYRPVIAYKATADGSERFLFGNYPIRNGEIRLRELDRNVLDDRARIQKALTLCNRARLVAPHLTDSFNSRGGGRYYYRVVTVDKAGIESDWAASALLPSPEAQGPLVVLDTTQPATPTLSVPKVVDGKVILEWQADPAVDEYWVYREPRGSEAEGEPYAKLRVRDLDNPAVSPRLESVPIVANTESVPIRCKGNPLELDLFWLPGKATAIGLYRADEYRHWLANRGVTITNLFASNVGQPVRLRKPDGQAENIRLNDVQVDLAVEYLSEHEELLYGVFKVAGGEVTLWKSPRIAALVGLYRIETYNPESPPCLLSGQLDLSGSYPVIRNVTDGGNPLPDGYGPVIRYRQTNDAGAPVRTLYGQYRVHGGIIELISRPDLPLLKGESASGTVLLPARYASDAISIVGVHRRSEFEQHGARAQNHYQGTYDGIKIVGLALADGDEVVIRILTLHVEHADRLAYESIRIEGFPQVVGIDSIHLIDERTGLQEVSFEPSAFDPTNPDSIQLPLSIIASPAGVPATFVIAYRDEFEVSRTLTVATTDSELPVVRSALLPAGFAPYISEMIRLRRKDEFSSGDPQAGADPTVAAGDRVLFRRRGSVIAIHQDAGLGRSENGARIPLVIQIRDHHDAVHTIASQPNRLRFTDRDVTANLAFEYAVKGVRVLRRSLASEMHAASHPSQAMSAMLRDTTPPIPPDVTVIRVGEAGPELRWDVVDTIAHYVIERRPDELNVWQPVSPPLVPEPDQTQMAFDDTAAPTGRRYFYRLAVAGRNGLPNVEFQRDPAVADLR